MSRLIAIAALGFLAACSATASNGTGTGVFPAAGLSASASSTQNELWVCHGNKKPKWKHVAAPAVDAHRRHGDRVVNTPHSRMDQREG